MPLFIFYVQISIDAMQCMVEEYKKLRQRDASSGSSSAWRITVRQLESLVRLSEAMARLHCADTVIYQCHLYYFEHNHISRFYSLMSIIFIILILYYALFSLSSWNNMCYAQMLLYFYQT